MFHQDVYLYLVYKSYLFILLVSDIMNRISLHVIEGKLDTMANSREGTSKKHTSHRPLKST